MNKCPRCCSFTLTTSFCSYCAVCNYSSETDVTLQPIYKKWPESALSKNRILSFETNKNVKVMRYENSVEENR